MKIFLKYIRRNVFEKKGRLVLLLFSISISVALLVTSIGFVDIIKNVILLPVKSTTEGMDIVITSTQDDQFFELDDINLTGVGECFGEINAVGVRDQDGELNYVTIRGRDNIELSKIISGSLSGFKGSECIISERIGEQLHLTVGDSLEISVNGADKVFKITAISEDTGIYYTDKKQNFTMVVPYNYLAGEFEISNKYNVVYAKSAGDNTKDAIKMLNDNNSGFKAQQIYDEDNLMSGYDTIATVFYALLAIVVLISFMIIYGTFNLILNERIPVIGTFLSQGATNSKVKSILYLESIGYGILGGAVGVGLGVVFLSLISNAYSPLSEYGVKTDISINPLYLLIGFLFSIILSLVSAYMPVSRINKMPVKDIILDNLSNVFKIGNMKFGIGLAFIVISLVGYFVEASWTYSLSIVFMVLSISGIVLVLPKLLNVLTLLVCKALHGRNTLGFLAFHNIRSSKVLINNITLIMIALLTSIIISSASRSIVVYTNEAYERMDYDLNIENILESYDTESTTDKIIGKLKKIDYIDHDSINPLIHISGNINGQSAQIIGVNTATFMSYMEYLELQEGDNKEVYDAFKKSKNGVILSDTVQESINKKEGDFISIKIKDTEKIFQVIGSVNGKLYDNGIFVIMDGEHIKTQYGVTETGSITVKTSITAEDAKVKLNKIVKKYGATVSTREENVTQSLKNTESTSQIFAVFTYIAISIAGIGIVNNMLISFIQRKKDFAVFLLVGMTSGKNKMLIVAEALLSAFWAFLFMFPYSFIVLRLLSKFISFLGIPMDIKLATSTIPEIIFLIVAGIFIALIPTIVRARKLSVISEIKAE